MTLPPIYIVAASRTPIASYLGALSSMTAPQLGAATIKASLSRAKVDPKLVGEVLMGHVLTAGAGQAPARQAARYAGIGDEVPATTINKVCGSGLAAVIMGAKSIALGDAEVVVAGGMESMSRVPYYLPKAREGYRLGHGELVDGLIFDGLWDPYGDVHMGSCGELCAAEHKLTREAQDYFARESYRRALAAQKEGLFNAELVPVEVPQRRGEPVVFDTDEEPGRGKLEKFGQLRPAFKKDGTITAANASSLNDGASALVLASEKVVKEQKLEPLAMIEGYGGAAQAPEWFTTAPAAAIKNTLSKLDLKTEQIGLHEINEAFAVVTLAVAQMCDIEPARINVNGGAVALGHPIGASGARILTTLVHAMKARDEERGMASICIGGGEALAMVLRRV